MAPIRIAGPGDAATLARVLAALSAELGEDHRADAEALAEAMARPFPPFRAAIAGETGAALYSPLYSTVMGGAGVYVADLWVAPEARGIGLGRRLLHAVAEDADAVWGARFLTLAVYDHSRDAMAFYRRLGFRPVRGQERLMLDPAPFAALKGET